MNAESAGAWLRKLPSRADERLDLRGMTARADPARPRQLTGTHVARRAAMYATDPAIVRMLAGLDG